MFAKRDPGGLVQQIIDDATAAGWPTGIAVGHSAVGLVTAASDPQRSLDSYARAVDIAASVGNWYAEAGAQRSRLNVQFAALPPEELANVTVDVLRRYHAMGDSVNVTHTVGFALVVLADADAQRLEASAAVLGWLSGRPVCHADPLGRLAEVRSTVEESLGEKTPSLIDAGRMMSVDDLVELTSTELDAIKQ